MIRTKKLSFIELKSGKIKAAINITPKDKINISSSEHELYEVVTDSGLLYIDRGCKLLNFNTLKLTKIENIKVGTVIQIYPQNIEVESPLSITKSAMYNLGYFNAQGIIYQKTILFSEHIFTHTRVRLFHYLKGFIDGIATVSKKGRALKIGYSNVIEGICKLMLDLGIEFKLSKSNKVIYCIKISNDSYNNLDAICNGKKPSTITNVVFTAIILKVNKINKLVSCIDLDKSELLINNFLITK